MKKQNKEDRKQKSPSSSKKTTFAAGTEMLHHLAFDNSFIANIILTVSSGKIITANMAACNLLGYTKEELLAKNRVDIFDINESSFKKMEKQLTAERRSAALLNVIPKSASPLVCEITSAVFMDEDGIEKSITTITDMTESILKQKNRDAKKEKIVAYNIALAISDQKIIDTRNERIVAGNIVLAILKQVDIDDKNKKIVAKNISMALAKQKAIDIRNQKIIASNIARTSLNQLKIDARKEKIVATNIILAQTKSDARLVENNEWIKSIAQLSYDVMWDWDIATGQINVSDSIEEVFGYKGQNNTVSFSNVKRCLLLTEKDIVEKKLLKTLASKDKSWNDAFMFKRHDGSVASTISRASIVRDKKGEAKRLIGVIQDISKLQQLENKLEEQINTQEEHSKTFFLAAKITSDVIWDWNLLTGKLFRGEGFEKVFDYSEKNNKGNFADWSDHVHPEDREAVEKGIYDAIASSDTTWEQSYRFIRVDGSIAKVFDRAGIFRQADGKAYRLIGAMQDITERKKTEREKEMVIKELMKSNADLKQFSYITSHNLRAPLSNIESILSIIDYSTIGTANAELLKMLNTSGKQLSKTIEDLTRILVIKKNVNAQMGTLNLTDHFIRVNNIFSAALDEAGAQVFTDFKELHVHFNENYFESILINLFSNAIKYRSTERSLVINVIAENDNKGNIIFSFSDNGTGIDLKRHEDKLFGLYQRFHENIEGQGLGLYIIKSQIEALNSTIEIQSEVDKGTSFVITFKKNR